MHHVDPLNASVNEVDRRIGLESGEETPTPLLLYCWPEDVVRQRRMRRVGTRPKLALVFMCCLGRRMEVIRRAPTPPHVQF